LEPGTGGNVYGTPLEVNGRVYVAVYENVTVFGLGQ
jgi:hypothetical protein